MKLEDVEDLIESQKLNWTAKEHSLGELISDGNFGGFGFSPRTKQP